GGEEMLKLIARYRIAPGTLILEVTESCRMDDPLQLLEHDRRRGDAKADRPLPHRPGHPHPRGDGELPDGRSA
ncbi:hypothetical protein CQA88_32095, partial [Klebsiella pneumoniae]